eukprot:UN06314
MIQQLCDLIATHKVTFNIMKTEDSGLAKRSLWEARSKLETALETADSKGHTTIVPMCDR